MGNEMSTVNQRDPQPGDLIEIFGVGYQHWVVYIGGGYVVHLTVPTVESGSSGISRISGISGGGPGRDNMKAIVKKDTLKDAVQHRKWKINNLLDDKHKPRDAYVIVKKALSQVGTEHQYHLLGYNCEHFATKLRYGQGESQQVRKAGEVVTASGVDIVAVLGLVALAGAIFVGGSKEKKNTR